MANFPRAAGALPRFATVPRFAGGLQSWGQSGRGQARAVGNMGRTWTETYPLLDTGNPSVRALIQALNQSLREGTVWDVQHPYWHARKGAGGGTPLVNGAGQTGSSLIVSGTQVQIVTYPENFGAWGLAGTPLRTSGQVDPFGGTAAYLLEDDDGAVDENFLLSVVFTGNGTKLVALMLKADNAADVDFGINDATAVTWRHLARVTWSNGIPTLSTAQGAGTLHAPQNYGGGWWRLQISVNGVVAANANEFRIYPASSISARTGRVFAFGAQAFNQSNPTSDYYWLRQGDIIKVTGAAAVFDVAGNVSTNGSGQATIPISPPIFVGQSPANGASVEITPASIFFKAVITNVGDLPLMDVTRFIDPGMMLTWREQPQ